MRAYLRVGLATLSRPRVAQSEKPVTSANPTSTPRLRRLGDQQSFTQYMADIWRRREFVWNIAAGNLRAQHMDTALGQLWHVINPMLLLGVYYLIFGVLIERGPSMGLDNYIGFLAVGIFVYNYCQRSISSGASSIVGNMGLIRSLQFPRAVLPVSAVVQALIAFAPSAIVMLFLLLITGEQPGLGWLMVLPITAVATLFGIGGALITSRLTEQARDIQNVLPYLFRLTFYLSGILYSVDQILASERFVDVADTLRTLFLLNPFYDIVEISRHYLMSSYDVPNVLEMWGALLGITVVTLVVGLVFFRRGEGSYGRG